VSDLRIIGGKARGRRIHSVSGATTRPITDKVREALFNIIGPDILEASFLDLFAGTGSVGIEALSRGAKYVCFVELNRQPIAIIRENLKTTSLDEGAVVVHADAFNFLARPINHRFDYIYIAPPQYKGMWIRALKTVDTNVDWLTNDAWVIVQIHPIEYQVISEELPIKNLAEFDRRHYGSTLLVFYRKSMDELVDIGDADS
jgi:16S rRNA (guanine(966)-N(2))-methyltransferase RsmD